MVFIDISRFNLSLCMLLWRLTKLEASMAWGGGYDGVLSLNHPLQPVLLSGQKRREKEKEQYFKVSYSRAYLSSKGRTLMPTLILSMT